LDSPKEIIGKRNIDLPDFVVSDVLDKVNKQVIEKGETVIVEEPAIEKDGSQSTYLSHKSPLRDHSGTIIGLIGVSINITQRKKMEEAMNLAKEEAEIANETKSQFIENMEHDIRTPFVGVYGMIDVLAQQETDPSKKALFADIAMCAKELMNYCDSILDFSKVDSGLLPYTLKCFELRKVIDSVVAIQTLPAKTKGIDFKFSYDANLPRVVKGDQYRLNRTLINLVSNAVKFTSEGYVRLSVSLVRQDHEKREVVVNFLIEDTGMGIPEDKRAAVFERFVRLNASNKGRYKGQGLGLSIVNHFIDDMGGDIHVKSELGKGSSFIVCLPFKIPLTDEILDVE
jgi:signal transduction histidine kinase